MGKTGDQSLEFAQNKTLLESSYNGVKVHLFEVWEPSQYIYMGPVSLIAQPYQEIQPGDDGIDRKVWMFPLKLEEAPKSLEKRVFNNYKQRRQKSARLLADSELKKRASQGGNKKPTARKATTSTFIRDEYVAEYARRQANGFCQLCSTKAPFKDKDGRPYLESHHIEWLKKGGSDTIGNTIALCANCHRKMHVLDLPEDKALLLKKNGNVKRASLIKKDTQSYIFSNKSHNSFSSSFHLLITL